MPEYLAPGVYVEETSFRAKSIEGVSTSTAGFVGPARYGPVDGLPELITSFQEFERVFGGSERLEYFGERDRSHNYLAHGIRGFFDNGGRRVYVSRIYELPEPPEGVPVPAEMQAVLSAGGRASFEGPGLTLRARYPGAAGDCRVAFTLRVSENVLAVQRPSLDEPGHNVLRGVAPDDIVWVADPAEPASPPQPPTSGTIARAERYFHDGLGRNTWRFHPGDEAEAAVELETLNVDEDEPPSSVHRLTVAVEVTFVDRLGTILRRDAWESLGFTPDSPDSLPFVFNPAIPSRTVELRTPILLETELNGPELVEALIEMLSALDTASQPIDTNVLAAHNRRFEVPLTGGSDGARPGPRAYVGESFDDGRRKSGLLALEDVSDISIVAAPGYSFARSVPEGLTRTQSVSNALVSHAERMQYRIAVLDAANDAGLGDVRAQRAQLDSTHAALYYPWVRVLDPVTSQEIVLPPSGFVAGIYARNDVEKGVHKAPANEVVRGALGFEVTLNKGQQDVLNPEGVNCFRFLEGRGNRLWGARTATSDPEWKYVNLRRYFAFLERSIERGTQWVVFENNGYSLWANVRRTIEDFLFNEWKQDHLLGDKPESAYFVRCDRTTMTQNDLDNGRLVCLIGVAPLRPAEFVIFRIGQWTGDRKV